MNADTRPLHCEYVVVGSGAGGGTLAARLAEAGHSVVLLEAGGDPRELHCPDPTRPDRNCLPDHYDVPVFHAFASENDAMKWDFFVRHYGDLESQKRDEKFRAEHDGVLYPRAGTLGGCTAHNAMIMVYPHNDDWRHIEELTGDPSWNPENMRKYFERVENCRHRPFHRLLACAGIGSPSRHGWNGWLHTEKAVPKSALGDSSLVKTILECAHAAAHKVSHPIDRVRWLLQGKADPNDWRLVQDNAVGIRYTPLATRGHQRMGARERVLEVARRHPDRLRIELDALATRVIFDEDNRAIGVEYLKGERLYRAHANPSTEKGKKHEVRASREVILAGGAFNTPQLLMLSGVGDPAELGKHGIDVRVDLPGVGRNLQDRYEVGVVNQMAAPWKVLEGATFTCDDPQYREWKEKREGVYTTNGAVLAVIKKSSEKRPLPDLFCFGLLGDFRGYFPGYSKLFRERLDCLTWAILKAHTRNQAGSVTLRSAIARDTPLINFRYFGEGSDAAGEDLESVVDGIRFVRCMTEELKNRGLIAGEELPGERVQSDEELRQFVRDNAWGHHASCTCPIGRRDKGGVLGSDFRVHGTRGLRVVDASVFPRIPGFFIVSAVYMIAEKAADVILRDAQARGQQEELVGDDYRQWKAVLQEEIAEIERRPDREERPTKEKDLLGLAFSGGGIRSATFGLGVLEGLKDFKVLDKVDYLSTVSGGGYIGAWLSANCKRAADRGENWLLARKTEWDKSIAHLRRYSKYLAPEVGFFSADTWSMLAIWLRNAMLVQLTIIFAIAVALLAPRPLLELFVAWPGVGHWRWVTVAVFVLAVVGIAGNQLRRGSEGETKLVIKAEFGCKGFLIGAAILVGTLVFGKWQHFEPFNDEAVNFCVAFIIAALLIIAGFFFLSTGVKILRWYELRCRRNAVPPQQIDYDQGWVQWAVVIPMLVTGYLVGAVLWGQAVAHPVLKDVETFGGFFVHQIQYWPFPLQVALTSLWLLSFCSIRLQEGTLWRKVRRLLIAAFAPAPAVLVLYLLLCAIMLLLHSWAGDLDKGQWLAFIWAPSLVLFAFTFAIVVLIGMMGRQSHESVREWWSRLGAWLAIYGVSWLVIAIAAVYGPLGAAYVLNGEFWTHLAAVGGWLGTTLAGLLAGGSGATGGKSGSNEAQKSTADVVKEVIAKAAPFVFIAGLLVAVATCLHLIILNFSTYGDVWTFDLLRDRHWDYMSAQPRAVVWSALAVAAAVTALLAWRVDINEFSLNAFYRNRLSRCYLGATRFHGERKPQNFTGFDEKDDLRLADVRRQGDDRLAGPLHVVNCALNLAGSSDLAVHTRHSMSFTLTPFSTGSTYRDIGFRRTARYGGLTGQPTLAQAISVSGAAASPNMGYHTSPVVAFLLTLFNARLGWWFPNPQQAGAAPSPPFSLKYLLMELFGVASDKSNYLMISDGGHFENLAAYELVRRRCGIIIVSDGECDPDLKFEGLGTLIRMCEVDFKTKINIDVESIRRAAGARWSGACSAVGTIEYPDSEDGEAFTGYLIYMKASMTGHENTAVLQYKDASPAFPHEPTGNQFYGEDQFESYRKLGWETAKRTFEAVMTEEDKRRNKAAEDKKKEAEKRKPRSPLAVMAEELERRFTPAQPNAANFTRLSDQLMELWNELAKNPRLRVLDDARESDLNGSFSGNESFRAAYFHCCQMIQLMENVYLDLDLENTWGHPDNAGWRNTFEEWSGSPALQKTWALSRGAYGRRFQSFCDRMLPRLNGSAR